MIDLIFKLVVIGVLVLGTAWFFAYYAISFKYKSDPAFKAARSKVSFIKSQPRTSLNLFSVYWCIEISIYGLLVIACALLALQYGIRWFSK
jgi:hypothetical protein